MTITVGIFEAKTKLSELLEKVLTGEDVVTITAEETAEVVLVDVLG